MFNRIKVIKLFESKRNGEPEGAVKGASFRIRNGIDNLSFDVFEMENGELNIFLPKETKGRLIE